MGSPRQKAPRDDDVCWDCHVTPLCSVPRSDRERVFALFPLVFWYRREATVFLSLQGFQRKPKQSDSFIVVASETLGEHGNLVFAFFLLTFPRGNLCFCFRI